MKDGKVLNARVIDKIATKGSTNPAYLNREMHKVAQLIKRSK